jgi:hypothetical protein
LRSPPEPSIGWRGRAGGFARADVGRPKRGRWGLRLLLALGWLLLLSTAFVFGYLLAEHDAQTLLARVQVLQTERDMLTEQVAAEREARARLERSHQIDVQARRSAQEQLNALEHDRMLLEQDLAQLRALVNASGRGVVDVRELLVKPGSDGGFDYRFTLDQLVPDLGKTEGEAVVSLVGRRDGELVEGALADMSEGDAGRHQFGFEHSTQLEGRFELAPDLQPVKLIVEILPKGDTFIASKHAVAWSEALAAGIANHAGPGGLALEELDPAH